VPADRREANRRAPVVQRGRVDLARHRVAFADLLALPTST